MTFDYSGLQTICQDQIEAFGTTATLKQTSVTGGDNWNPTTSEASTTVNVVETMFDNRDIDGETILATDRKIIMSPEGVTTAPDARDTITLNSLDYRVIRVIEYRGGDGTIMAYECQARI